MVFETAVFAGFVLLDLLFGCRIIPEYSNPTSRRNSYTSKNHIGLVLVVVDPIWKTI